MLRKLLRRQESLQQRRPDIKHAYELRIPVRHDQRVLAALSVDLLQPRACVLYSQIVTDLVGENVIVIVQKLETIPLLGTILAML